MWLKWSPLLAVAMAAVFSLSALAPVRVSADPPSAKETESPSEPGVSKANSSSDSVSALPNSRNKQAVPPPKEPSLLANKDAVPDRHLTRGQRLARTALSYRGVPYRWGGRSPRSGFDCSGLVQAVCAKWGIYLPRVARAQFKTGVPIKPEQLQAGDLVFFKNTYRRGLSHVGLYIGEGYFLHAPGRGKHVSLSRLDSAYNKKHWAGARRLDLSKLPPVAGEEAPSPDRVILEDAPTGDASITGTTPQATP